MKTIKEKIFTRGYWLVTIRPVSFIEKRIPDISELYPIIQKNSVRLRGWNFPHLDIRNPPKIDIDWVGEDFEWEHYLSSWRFYQSGLFTHLSGFSVDWRDQSNLWPAYEDWKPNVLLGAGSVIFQYTEIFEFASRLALSSAGDDSMFVEIKIGNLEGRMLFMDDRNKWGFFRNYTTTIREFPFNIKCSKSELLAESRNIAVNASVELFKRFGWDVERDQVSSWQVQILKRG